MGRRHYPERELFHIEGSLHEIGVTRMSQDGAAGLAERYAVKELGIESLERTCGEFFSHRFVECSRFDPLHEAKSEQLIYDKLHTWLAQLKRHDKLELSVAFDGYDFRAKVESRELGNYQRKVAEPLVQKLRSLLNGQPCALQVNAKLGAFSGVIEALLALPNCDLYVLEAGAAARGVMRRHQSFPPTDAGFRLATALPWDHSAVKPLPAERRGDVGRAVRADGECAVPVAEVDVGDPPDRAEDGGVVYHKRDRSECRLELRRNRLRERAVELRVSDHRDPLARDTQRPWI